MATKKKTLDEMLDEALVPTEEQPYKVPQNWMWSKLGSNCNKLQYGYTSKSTSENIGPHYLRITDIQNNKVDWDTVPFCEIEDNNLSKYKLNTGNIVVARTGATTGKSYIIKRDKLAVFASYLIRIENNRNLLSEYLNNFMNSDYYWNQITMKKKGIAQPGVNAKKLGELQIPIPPLKEQARIVNRIELLFNKIDRAKELIEEAREGFENRKAAILAKAFRGELTAKWRQENTEVESAEELLNRIEQEKNKVTDKKKKNSENNEIKDELYELPENWKWVKICDIVYEISDKVIPNEEQVFSYIGLEHMRKGGGLIRVSNTKDVKSSKTVFKDGDVLYGRLRPYLNKHSIVEFAGVCSTDIIVFRCKKLFNNVLLDHYLGLPSVIGYAVGNSKGINLPRISGKALRELSIPLPPLEEQKEIVRILDKLLEEESRIEDLTDIEEQIEVMKKAILAKAFRGELGTNDPEEESAIKLLKEILAEKSKVAEAQDKGNDKRINKKDMARKIRDTQKNGKSDLIQILIEQGELITPERLFELSHMSDRYEFYFELKSIVESGKVREIKDVNNSISLLEVVK